MELNAREIMSATSARPPTSSKHLFVYGTLMRGQIRHHLLAPGGIQSIVPASISGQLIDLGEYPGVLLSTHIQQRVTGELIEFASLDKILEAIDAEEGPDFRREIVHVTLRDGRDQFAWTYVFSTGQLAQHAVIPSGNWRSKVPGS